MRKVKKIITYIIALILSVLFISSILIYLLSSTILSKDYVLDKLDETNYYEQVYELVESNFENYIQQSGLDEDVIENIVTEDKIKEDTKQILTNLYDGANEEISTEEIAEQLNANIEESLEDRDLTSDEEEAIKSFVQTICDEYEDTIIHTKYEEEINNIYQKIINYKKYAVQVLSITIGILLVVLIIMNHRAIYRSVKAVAISLLTNGILLLITNFYINSNLKIQTITILNNAFSEVIVNILTEIMSKILTYGWILTVIGVLLIIVSNLTHNLRKYGIEEREENGRNRSNGTN